MLKKCTVYQNSAFFCFRYVVETKPDFFFLFLTLPFHLLRSQIELKINTLIIILVRLPRFPSFYFFLLL